MSLLTVEITIEDQYEPGSIRVTLVEQGPAGAVLPGLASDAVRRALAAAHADAPAPKAVGDPKASA